MTTPQLYRNNILLPTSQGVRAIFPGSSMPFGATAQPVTVDAAQAGVQTGFAVDMPIPNPASLIGAWVAGFNWNVTSAAAGGATGRPVLTMQQVPPGGGVLGGGTPVTIDQAAQGSTQAIDAMGGPFTENLTRNLLSQQLAPGLEPWGPDFLLRLRVDFEVVLTGSGNATIEFEMTAPLGQGAPFALDLMIGGGIVASR